jgi:hypothetical protein
MASTLRLKLSVDLGSLVEDLDSVEIGLGQEVGKVLKRGADDIAALVRKRMPLGPGPQGGKDKLPHIRDTVAGYANQLTATVAGQHPAVQVLNYGGTIAPRGAEIHFPHKHYAQQAGDELMPKLEQQAQDAIDELAARYLN